MLGVSAGFCSSNNAAAPDTIGADIEVPLRVIYPLLVAFDTLKSGYSLIILLLSASAEMIAFPGATRSGFTRLSAYVGPEELNVVISSSERASVACVLVAPTVSTIGSMPGLTMVP